MIQTKAQLKASYKYYFKNKKRLNKQKVENSRKKRIENPELTKQKDKKNYERYKMNKNYKDVRKDIRIRYESRLKSFNDKTVNQKRIDELLYLQKNKCNICSINIEKYYEKDHIIPLSKNWPHSIHNIQLLCMKCNRMKSNNLVF